MKKNIFLETGAYVTFIKLEHTLFTELAAGHPLNGFDAQDPFVIYNNDESDYYSEISKQRPTAPERPSHVSTYQQTSDT